MQNILEELQTVYQEGPQHNDRSCGSQTETPQSKVGMLRLFAAGLFVSEQRKHLIQRSEPESRVTEGKMSSPYKELERCPSLALCPMPADLAGTTETFLRTQRVPRPATQTSCGEQAVHHADLRQHMHEGWHQQLKQALLSQHEAQAQVVEREAQVQELQDSITELHQEMTRKDQEQLRQLRHLHQLEASVNGLSDQLPRRDETIQRLRRDVLLSHQARDSQTAQLDIQEQRISQLQTELQESRLELRRTQSRVQQHQKQLQSQTQQAQELQTQLAAVKGRLVQVERENEALMGCKREQRAEVGRLTLQSPAQGRTAAECSQVECRCKDLEDKLPQSLAQATQGQDRAQDANRRAEEKILQLHAELSILKVQHGCLNQQLEGREAKQQRAQTATAELHEREREFETERAVLQGQLNCAREELRSATHRGEAKRQREEQLSELQVEIDRPKALLQDERQEMQRKLCEAEEQMKRLKEEQQQLKDKVTLGEVQAEKAEQDLREERRLRDGERKERRQAASEALRLWEAELEELHWARDTALRSWRLQEERSLVAQNQGLQHSQGEPQDRIVQREETLGAIREKLRLQEKDTHILRQQLSSSQDALQRVVAELRSTRTERHKQDTRCVETEGKMAEVKADLVQLQQQYTTCYAQLIQEEAEVSRLRGELQEVAARDETMLKMTMDQLSVQTEQEFALREEALTLQEEVKSLQTGQRQRDEAMEAECQRNSQLQQDRDSLLSQRSSQQEAVDAAHGELQRWQAEARAQQEAREEEVAGLQAELRAAQSRLHQSRFTIGHLRSDLEHTQRQHKLAGEQACQRDSHIWALEAELNRLKADLQEAESRTGDTETRLQPLSQSLELYRTKYQACLSKLAQQDSTLQAVQEDVREARAQLVEREEQVMRLRGQAVALQGELKAQAGQLECGEEALSAASHRLRDTQTELDSSRKHSQECELVTGTLRETNARLRQQVEEQKESMVKIQADFSVYRASHIHSNSDYECQLSNIQESQQALSQAREQCAQGVQELSVYQAEVCQLRDEVSRLNRLKDSCLAEVSLLREAGEQLQAAVLLEGRGRQQEAAALEQKVARLEQDLEAAHSQTTDREQAVQKRDGLLRQSEADLLQARDAVRRGAAEAERQAAAARGLEAELQRCGTESQQREAQCGLLLAQLLQRTQELKGAQDRCRDTAQELARQEERALLLEGGQQQAQEQLAERVAEVVKAERARRKLQAELQRLKEKLHTTEHELQSYRTQVEHLRKEVEESRQAQLGCQQEAHSHKQQVLQLEGELRQSRETLKTSQQNCQEQAEACILLRAELSQEQDRQQAQQARMSSSRKREIKLEAEREQLQTSLASAHRQLKEQERTAGGLQECVSELQSAIQRQQEEQMVQLQQCKAELGNREAQSQKHSREVEALHSELESVEQKYSVAAAEVEVLRRSLGGARSDSSRLHKESELVLSSVNRLVQEHKQANEKLALKMKEQSKKIIHLTAEKDHLQESAEGLQIEVRRVKADLDEKRIEAERFQASEASVHDQRSALTKVPIHLINTESALIGQGASPRRRRRKASAADLPQHI